jgi:hypothetical protein
MGRAMEEGIAPVDADGCLVVLCLVGDLVAHIPTARASSPATDISLLVQTGDKAVNSKSTKVHVQRTKDIPQGEHWAILDDNSLRIPGDERSRSAPGHGYPESTEHYVGYTAYTDREEFEEDLRRLTCDPCDGSQVRGIYVMGSYTVQRTVALTPPHPMMKNQINPVLYTK